MNSEQLGQIDDQLAQLRRDQLYYLAQRILLERKRSLLIGTLTFILGVFFGALMVLSNG